MSGVPTEFDPLSIGGWRPAPGEEVYASNVNIPTPVTALNVVKIMADLDPAASWYIVRFAAHTGTNPSYLGLQKSSSTTVRFFNGSTVSSVSPNYTFDKGKANVFVFDNVGVWLNDVLTYEYARTSGTYPFLTVSPKIKLWYVSIERDGVDIARYVPYTNGKEIKLYDEVSKKFLT